MKKTMALVLVVALMVAMFAGIAEAKGRPAGKGKPADKGNPVVTYVFKGDVASVQDGSVTVDVQRANKFAQSYVGQQVEISVSDSTRIVKDDAPATLTDLVRGDKVVVQSRAPRLGAESFTASGIVAESAAAQN
ncbi:MAG TPA: hypothetical protein VFJ72_16370 [Rubrobacteraceae bacterium]|nr:hypothetical protein [Rubrobacteraceae bacterium]